VESIRSAPIKRRLSSRSARNSPSARRLSPSDSSQRRGCASAFPPWKSELALAPVSGSGRVVSRSLAHNDACITADCLRRQPFLSCQSRIPRKSNPLRRVSRPPDTVEYLEVSVCTNATPLQSVLPMLPLSAFLFREMLLRAPLIRAYFSQ